MRLLKSILKKIVKYYANEYLSYESTLFINSEFLRVYSKYSCFDKNKKFYLNEQFEISQKRKRIKHKIMFFDNIYQKLFRSSLIGDDYKKLLFNNG